MRWLRTLACAGLVLGAASATSTADVPVESPGRVESLPATLGPHWVWAADAVLQRSALVDLDSGRLLGVVDGGYGFSTALFPRARRELYVPETHYSRRSRGERTDVVTFYDAHSLAPLAEVVIPPKRAMNPLPSANAALSDDDRFLAVFNMNPATSLSIVDLERRVFVGEIATPGCSLVYAAGRRRFAMLCADGALLTVTLDDAGAEVSKLRSRPFFDPQRDPVTEKAVRWRDEWLFVSFDGLVHAVDVSGAEPRFREPWSLLGADDRRADWRIGGSQHLALHAATGRLYSLVHQGGPDTHKQSGSELWVYDLATHERLQRIELRNPGLTYLGVPLEFGQGWLWPFHQLYDWMLALAAAPELGVGEIAVTQDARPLLITGSNFTGSLGIYDALSGDFLRRVVTGNMTVLVLQSPWDGGSLP